jgi:hypothetical protein
MEDAENQVITNSTFAHILCAVNLKQISQGNIRTK